MDAIEKTEANEGGGSERTLIVERTFNAPRALVFKVWTQPEHVVRWWGCAQSTETEFACDPVPGGRFRALMTMESGALLLLTGTYKEVVEPERLVFTWAWTDEDGNPGHETLVTVTFEEQDGKTHLTLRQEVFEDAKTCGEHGEGWGYGLAQMETLLETLMVPA